MLKRIVLSVVMLVICVPLHAVKVTFKRIDRTAHEYTIVKSCTQILQEAPVQMAVSRQRAYTLNAQTPYLELDIDPRDVIHIFTYIQKYSSPVRSACKGFSVAHNSLVLITEKNCKIIPEENARM